MIQEEQTVESILKAWDNGDSIWSIEMGGLGPGYEQCIQVCAIEITRELKDFEPDNDTNKTWQSWLDLSDKVLHRINKKHKLGLSGAQAGAARNLAYQWVCGSGPADVLKEVEADRHIQVSNNWVKI